MSAAVRSVRVYGRGRWHEALVDAGDYELVAGYRWNMSSGYAIRRFVLPDGRQRLWPMHREILGLAVGDPRICHHVNEDKLDNRRANLEVYASRSEANERPHPKRDAVCRQQAYSRLEQAA